jgi:outer membrane protein
MQVPGDPVTVEVGGIRQDVIFFNTVGITYPNQGFGDQLNENFGQSLGLSLSVPIYNNHRNNIAAERARLNVISAELTSRQVTDQLKTDVETAITSFRAARNAYQASQRSLTASEAAFADAQRRFDLGAINSFEYNNAVNNQDIARRDLTRAKYQLLFNLKVVEFYLGQPLNL